MGYRWAPITYSYGSFGSHNCMVMTSKVGSTKYPPIYGKERVHTSWTLPNNGKNLVNVQVYIKTGQIHVSNITWHLYISPKNIFMLQNITNFAHTHHLQGFNRFEWFLPRCQKCTRFFKYVYLDIWILKTIHTTHNEDNCSSQILKFRDCGCPFSLSMVEWVLYSYIPGLGDNVFLLPGYSKRMWPKRLFTHS